MLYVIFINRYIPDFCNKPSILRCVYLEVALAKDKIPIKKPHSEEVEQQWSGNGPINIEKHFLSK